MASGTINVGAAGATFNFPSGLFSWTGGTLTGTLTNASTGFIPITSSTPGGTFNNLGTMTQSGGTVNLINSGTFTVTSGTVNLSGGTGGTLTETSSTVNVGASTFSGQYVLTGNGGTYNFTGIVANRGTLTLAGTSTSPAYQLTGGTINGGTINVASGTQLTATASSTLTGVTLAGLFTIDPSVTVTVNQRLTLSSGVVQLQGGQNINGGNLASFGAAVRRLGHADARGRDGHDGQVNFAGSAGTGSPDELYSNAGPLVIGTGVTLVNTTANGAMGSREKRSPSTARRPPAAARPSASSAPRSPTLAARRRRLWPTAGVP